MKRAFKFDQRLFYSGKERYYGSSKAKAVAETYPDVFDLESMIISKQTQECGITHLNVDCQNWFIKTMFSALLNKSDDPYCGHREL